LERSKQNKITHKKMLDEIISSTLNMIAGLSIIALMSVAMLNSKNVRVIPLIILLTILSVFCSLEVHLRLKKVERLRASSDVERRETLTNGMYRIMGMWKSPIGGHLVIIQPVVIGEISPNGRVNFTNTTPAMSLVNLDAGLIQGDASLTSVILVHSNAAGIHIVPFDTPQASPVK
jgi:hypothetical protein